MATMATQAVVLTEEMVLRHARASALEDVVNFNCWFV